MKQAVVLTMLLLSGLLSGAVSANNTLFVYIPSKLKAVILEERIKAQCPDYDVRVFGKSEEFRQQISEKSPHAVLSLPIIFETLPELTVYTQGQRNGRTNEKAVLLSLDKPVSPADIGRLRLGMLDLLGRKQSQAYVDKIFNASVQIIRVSKIEDLAPLIVFNMADAIFTTESYAEDIKSRSKLNLVVTPLQLEVGLTVGGEAPTASNSDVKQVIQCVKGFDDQLNEIFGVEHWTTLK